MNFEQELSNALRRRAPPGDLAGRVLASLEERESLGAARWSPASLVSLRAMALAAMLMVAVLGFVVARQNDARRQREREEQAARQVMTALRIASESLNDAMRSVRQ